MNKNKILNKKGTSTIETIILAPIVIYIFMLVLFKGMQVFMYGRVEQSCYDITRNVIVRDTLENGLNVIASKYLDSIGKEEPVDYQYIKSITLTNESGVSETLTFENAEFNDYIENKAFKYNDLRSDKKTKMESLWTYGTRISISYECNIVKVMNINSSVELFNPTTNKKETFVFGGNKIVATCENVLMFG